MIFDFKALYPPIIFLMFLIFRRHRVSKKYSPSRDMYNVSTKSEDTSNLQLQPLDNGNSQPALSEKDIEALEESAIVPPPTEPRSAITTEGKWKYMCT
jgi:hypothetical protein